jgi:hexosaminidase
LEPETEERLKRSLYFLNVWNTDGIEGFPVVLSPAPYTYLDLAYSDAPDEIGLSWAGYVDERKTFSLQPNNYKGDIIGVQAQLWSAQLRSFNDATYQMLPKVLGTAERGWNAFPDWPTESDFTSDFEQFYSIIGAKEMPVWEQKGLLYSHNPH